MLLYSNSLRYAYNYTVTVGGKPVDTALSNAVTGVEFTAPASSMLSGPRIEVSYSYDGRCCYTLPDTIFYTNAKLSITQSGTNTQVSTRSRTSTSFLVSGHIAAASTIMVMFVHSRLGNFTVEGSVSNSRVSFTYPLLPGFGVETWNMYATYDEVHLSNAIPIRHSSNSICSGRSCTACASAPECMFLVNSLSKS